MRQTPFQTFQMFIDADLTRGQYEIIRNTNETPTMHKKLIHGDVIIKHALLPIGQLSEEATEARNKHFRNYRQNFARKFSRESCHSDIFNQLRRSSDSLLSR